ncbi:hypothetical protein MGYG_05125 [Nannizzia gypsea CBS 118893]|uniref:Uncharacterized protein n=1 Tax=Arthroderma gypseum (strain ATCC MYA-4604 / CBS 118893) TaxID=535722 RepID=E4UYG0_ARTGP|nr:hypothetical protein MGYG_05125 [Nannizzia gypsea CBS 118893]EFR02123.1 hypothetical protein MGYG_05125 [Nannizzia gypsea CBS 118893]
MTVNIPTVTCDDLSAFHTKHFITQNFSPTAASDFFANSFNNTETHSTVYDDSYTDDLGYYPDGVKRTLTDEQIQIFRHSEIQALLRQKQLETEASSDSRNDTSNEEQCDQLTGASFDKRETIAQDGKELKKLKLPNKTNQSGMSSNPIAPATLDDVNRNGKPKGKSQQTLKPSTEFRRRIICYEDA